MEKLIAAEKARAGLRHALALCPNTIGNDNERIAQSKHARACSLAIIDKPHKWRELVSSGRFCLLMQFFLSLALRFVSLSLFCI